MKRFISFILTLAMVICVLPTNAFATEVSNTDAESNNRPFVEGIQDENGNEYSLDITNEDDEYSVSEPSMQMSSLQSEGFEYAVSDDGTATITAYTGNSEEVTIPSTIGGYTVSCIGAMAFYACRGLTSVTIPSGVTTISDYAFAYCSGLTSVTIPSGVTTISDYAFDGCYGLTSVTIPSGVTTISDYAFDSCSGLTSVTIPSSVTAIGDSAFRGCSGLTSVTIPSSVTTIGDSAFRGCSGLTSVTIPNSVTAIGDSAFAYCRGLTSVTIPSGVTTISKEAFYYCRGLTSVTIPSSVTVIGDTAFAHCSGLTSVTIPSSVTVIGDSAFDSCSGLTSVTIPSSVTAISDYAFLGCSGLTSVTIPNSVTTIGKYAFDSCSGLTSVTIPSSVTAIGDSVFRGCSGLTSVTIPNSVTTIGDSAFRGCSGLTSVAIPDSVTTIGDKAFYGCENLTIYGSSGSYAESYAKEKGIPFLTRFVPQSVTVLDGKYLIRVVDNNGKPVSGATVKYDKQTVTTGSDGNALFNQINFNPSPEITVTKDGYITWTNKNSNWKASSNNKETIIVYSNSVSRLKLKEALYIDDSGAIREFWNLLAQTKSLNIPNDGNLVGDLTLGKFEIRCKALSENSVAGYELWQNNKKISSSKNGIFALQTKDGFVKGGGCYIRVYDDKGNYADTNINLTFTENNIIKDFEISFGKDLKISVPDKVPFLGGSTFQVGGITKLPVEVKLSEERLYLGINAKIWTSEEKDTKKAFEKFKEKLNNARKAGRLELGKAGKEPFNDLIKNKKAFGLPGGKVDFTFTGYAECNWGSSIAKGEVIFKLSGETPAFGFTTWVVVVPVTVQIKGYAEGSISGVITYDWKNARLDGEIPYSIKLGLKAFGGVGVGKAVGVGTYGDANVTFKGELFTGAFFKNIDLTGELGVKAYLGPFEYKKAFAHNTWHLYTANNVYSLRNNNDVLGAPNVGNYTDVYNAAAYNIADLSYLQNESAWRAHPISRFSMNAHTSFNTLLAETYRNARPVMVSSGDKLYAAFLRADTLTGDVYTAITSFDGTSWKAPVRVDGLAHLDDSPQLMIDNSGTVWLAYTKSTLEAKPLTMDDYVLNRAVVIGIIDPETLTFNEVKTVYPDGGYLNSLSLGVKNGVARASWLESAITDEQSSLVPTSSTLYSITLADMAEPEVIANINAPVVDVTMGNQGTAVVVDTDMNLATIEDRQLVEYSMGGSNVIATGAIGNVTYGRIPGTNVDSYLWNQDDSLRSAAVSVAVPGITSEYMVVGNSVYYSSAVEDSAELCVVKYNEVSETWSDMIQITNGGRYLENLSAANLFGRDIVMGMYTDPTISENDVNDSKNLVWTFVQPVSDLRIDDISYDQSEAVPGKAIPVTVTVTNAGDHIVDGFTLTCGSETVTGQSIIPGGSAEVVVNITCPGQEETFNIQVAETSLSDDYTPENNMVSIKLGLANLKVNLECEQIGESRRLVAIVTNTGIASASGKIEFFDGNGEPCSSAEFEALEAGSVRVFTIDIDESFAGCYGGEGSVVITSNHDELYDYDNTASCYLPDTRVTEHIHVDKNHNGECDECKEIIDGIAKLYQASLSLSGNIAVNFYTVINNELTDEELSQMSMRFTLEDGTTSVVPYSEAIHKTSGGIDCVVFTCRVHSTQMSQKITATVCSGNEEKSSYEFSVKQYFDKVYDRANDKLKVLIDAMRNYGAAAQIRFGKYTDNLVAELGELPEPEDLSPYAHSISIIDDTLGISAKSASLLLHSETAIRVYFNISEGNALGDYTFTVKNADGRNAPFTLNADKDYLEIPNISADKLDDMYTITVSKNGVKALDITYGAFSYVRSAMNGSDENINNVVKALYHYNRAAEAYKSN